MKMNRIVFHIDKKRECFIMLIFALLLFLVGIFFAVSSKTACAHLTSLLRSKYTYSVISEKPVFQDDYYVFNAGIGYMLSPDSQSGLNAEVIMQSSDSLYSENVDWNIKELSQNQIAVTKGLAQSNNLKIGDKLYSKHIVDGTTHEYTIECVLPELSTARIPKEGGHTDGIILMGYDEQYVGSITFSILIFTNETLEELSKRTSNTPVNIIYRSDEIRHLTLSIIPFYLLSVLLGMLVVVGYVYCFSKQIKYNFKRFVILGYEKKQINNSYNTLIYGAGFLCILVSFGLALLVLIQLVFSLIEALVMITSTLTELVALLISGRLAKRQLWR